MREKLNSNPMAQVALVGVLLVAVGFFVMSSMGGGGAPSTKTTTSSATVTTPQGTASIQATVTTPTSAAPTDGSTAAPTSVAATPPVPAPPLPHPITAAFAANQTVVLLIVKPGGIDDGKVTAAVDRISSTPGVATFVVPARDIARYAAITQGVDVDRVPALVVVRPKDLDHGIPTATVNYGFQSVESVVQAVRDANYKGRTLAYHP